MPATADIRKNMDDAVGTPATAVTPAIVGMSWMAVKSGTRQCTDASKSRDAIDNRDDGSNVSDISNSRCTRNNRDGDSNTMDASKSRDVKNKMNDDT
jgi:hypothetical protein